MFWYPHVNGDRIAAALRQPVVVALIWIAALWKFIRAFVPLPGPAHWGDFAIYYDSAIALRKGLDPYTMDLTPIANRFGLRLHAVAHLAETPTFLLCFEPLTRFPPATAIWIWTLLNLVALVVAIYMLLARRPGLEANTSWLLAGLILAFYPVDWNFFWMQSQVLVLALMVLAMRAMEDEHEGTAGLLVALAGLLRAFPFLLLGYFALCRKWRALEFAIAGAVAGGLITTAILGFAQCFSFFNGAAYVANWMVTPFAISAAPFVSRVFWAVCGSPRAPAAKTLLLVAIGAADAIILGVTVRATLVGIDRRDDNYRIYSLWIVASVLLSPIAWHHYLVLLVIPFVQMVVAAGQGQVSRRALWMAAGSYLLASISVALTYRMLTPSAGLELTGPFRFSPLLETGFLTLLMGYIATYWFATDLRTEGHAVEPNQLAAQAPGIPRGVVRVLL